jgi:hypothetical protein
MSSRSAARRAVSRPSRIARAAFGPKARRGMGTTASRWHKILNTCVQTGRMVLLHAFTKKTQKTPPSRTGGGFEKKEEESQKEETAHRFLF